MLKKSFLGKTNSS